MQLKHLAGGLAIIGLASVAQAATDYPSGYTKCVQNTGATCTMSGTNNVALGKSGEFVYAVKTGSFACTGSAFPTNSFTTSAWCSVGPAATGSSSSAASSSVASSSSSKSSSSVAASSSSSSKSSSSSSSVAASSSSSKSSSSVASSVASSSIASNAKQVEKLDRGVTAIATSSGVFVSWRSLGTDIVGMTFNVYRGSTKLNSSPLSVTNYSDTGGSSSSSYVVKPVVNGVEQSGDSAKTTWGSNVKSIPLSPPSGGTSPDGVSYTYDANDGTAADLDGDGQYEIILKWQPTNAKDNSQSGYTGNTFIDAYKLDGTRMWRIDLGKNIRAGAHYTHMVAYDLDGDGKAEIMLKTADGTKDGKGTVIGSSSADYRNSSGYVLSGPEYLTVFNGQTGAAMATTDYYPARGTVSSWGDSYGNRVDRFLAGVAYVDGKRPSAIFSRGYYTRAVVVAWDWRDGKLSRRWVVDSNDSSNSKLAGQGAHYFSVADVNADGKDDIIYGAATISGAGSLLYSTGLCHGDALHVGDLDPNRAGLEVFMVHETPSCYSGKGLEMHDAKSGSILWSVSGEDTDVGRGVCADIDPNNAGVECWGSKGGLMSAAGKQISSSRPSPINFAIWWDGDLSRELLDGTTISKWNSGSLSTLLSASGAASNNGTKATPVLSADLFGDWREEVILRKSDNSALLIYSTTAATSYKFTTLMHNPQYRAQVAGQNMGYNQPPWPNYFLGNNMSTPAVVPVYTP
ncbi:MAG: rhamnogalacturonan lyase [Rhodocyclaceae bacterium]